MTGLFFSPGYAGQCPMHISRYSMRALKTAEKRTASSLFTEEAYALNELMYKTSAGRKKTAGTRSQAGAFTSSLREASGPGKGGKKPGDRGGQGPRGEGLGLRPRPSHESCPEEERALPAQYRPALWQGDMESDALPGGTEPVQKRQGSVNERPERDFCQAAQRERE